MASGAFWMGALWFPRVAGPAAAPPPSSLGPFGASWHLGLPSALSMAPTTALCSAERCRGLPLPAASHSLSRSRQQESANLPAFPFSLPGRAQASAASGAGLLAESNPRGLRVSPRVPEHA